MDSIDSIFVQVQIADSKIDGGKQVILMLLREIYSKQIYFHKKLFSHFRISI